MTHSSGNPEIPKLPDPETPSPWQDHFTADEQHLWEEYARQDIRDREQDREERKRYASNIYWLIVGWLGFIGALILASNQTLCNFINISDTVMMTLIGSTTASVLGIFIVVVKYLFHRP